MDTGALALAKLAGQNLLGRSAAHAPFEEDEFDEPLGGSLQRSPNLSDADLDSLAPPPSQTSATPSYYEEAGAGQLRRRASTFGGPPKHEAASLASIATRVRSQSSQARNSMSISTPSLPTRRSVPTVSPPRQAVQPEFEPIKEPAITPPGSAAPSSPEPEPAVSGRGAAPRVSALEAIQSFVLRQNGVKPPAPAALATGAAPRDPSDDETAPSLQRGRIRPPPSVTETKKMIFKRWLKNAASEKAAAQQEVRSRRPIPPGSSHRALRHHPAIVCLPCSLADAVTALDRWDSPLGPAGLGQADDTG